MMDVIDGFREEFGVEPICRVLPIAPSTYHGRKCPLTPYRGTAVSIADIILAGQGGNPQPALARTASCAETRSIAFIG